MPDWKETNKSNPCGCCGRSGWCAYSTTEGPITWYCMRPHKPEFAVPSGYKVIKETQDGGVVVAMSDDEKESNWKPRRKKLVLKDPEPQVDWVLEQGMRWSAARQDDIKSFADKLGVESISLHVLGIGRDEEKKAWSFPMLDEDLKTIGIRLRTDEGAKFAVKGSKSGVFAIPNSMESRLGEPVLISEGPTDTAALISIGFTCTIGRPSCSGGTDILLKLLQGHDVVIVSDSDGPGRNGSELLAKKLGRVAKRVRIIEPPAKDIREWVKDGATKESVDFLINNARDCNGRQVQSSTR